MSKENSLHTLSHLKAGIISGLITFAISYIILYRWQRDGFNTMEISLMAILTGIIIFFITIAVTIWHVNQYRKDCNIENIIPMKKVWSVLIIAVLSLLFLSLFDSILFYFIDKSIPQSYAEGLSNLVRSSGQETDSLNEFDEIPFMLQNSVVIIIAAIFGSLISILFIKKDGIIFGTTNDYIR